MQELWTGQTPKYEKLLIFGWEAFVLVPKDDCRKLEPRSRKCIFLSYKSDGEFGYRLWDLENKQIVQNSDIVFNESEIYKSAGRPINVKRVIFSDALPPPNGPTQHTREATWQVASMGQVGSERSYPNSDPPSGSTTQEMIISDYLVSPAIPRRSERFSQPLERYSPVIVFTNTGEPTSYEEASARPTSATWHCGCS